MTNRFLFLTPLLFVVISVFSQDITRQDADSMLAALKKSKQDIHRIDLLLHLAQFHIFKPGEQQMDFDSAMVYINEARILNRSVKSSTAHGYQLLTESYLAKEKGKRDEGKKMVEESITLLESGSNKSYLGSAFFELSQYYDYINSEQLPKKIALVKKSLDAFQQAGSMKNKARSLEMLGDLYIRKEDGSQAILALKQALATYDTIKYPKVQGVYILLGEAYMDQRDYGQGLFHMLKALKTAHMVNDTSMRLCQINNILGSLYWRIDRKDMSVKYKIDALETARKYHDEASIFLLAASISVNYNNLNQPDQALKVLASIPEKYLASIDSLRRAHLGMSYLRTYLALKQYGKALSYSDSILGLAENKTFDYQTRTAIYRLAASCYFYTKQYSKARDYLMKNLDIQKKVQNENGLIEDSKIWYKLDSVQGNFQSAFNHLFFLKTKTDSILSETKVRQLQVLSVEYETALKEDSIKLKDKDISLLKQKNSLQQANLKQANFIENVTIAGIILSLIIIGLLYRQYRHKQKNNKVITQKNQQLQHYLDEKEWLLKEIHHRVKNNLQIVMSLLNSQSAYIDNESALTAIHDSQHRVHAMSLIHQKLYNSENLSSIDMSIYIRELVSYLSDSFNTGQRIRFEFAIEPLEMDVSQAVPLGLILNEAITNSIKYAFPDGSDGRISISLSKITSYDYLLIIADNGIGIPLNLNNKKPGSLGMSLMAGLSEDLDGKFSFENNNGTTIKISFIHDPGVNRPEIPTASYVSNN